MPAGNPVLLHFCPMKEWKWLIVILVSIPLLYLGYRAVALAMELRDGRGRQFLSWWRGNAATREALVTVQREACPGAPFVLPAEGFIGLLYADPRGPYSERNPHQGIDIFSNTDPGTTPIYAAYDLSLIHISEPTRPY